MSSNPRRSGFRLPWLSDESGEEAGPGAAADVAAGPGETPSSAEARPSSEAATAAEPAAARPQPQPSATEDPSSPFLDNLISAMRSVVEDARTSTSSDLQSQLEARIAELRQRSSERVDELRQTTEREIAAVGDWATAEMERIRHEAAERVEARRRQLEQQLAAQAEQTEREIELARQRVTEYEGELSAFFAQLSEIKDPTAFVAAAKKVPAAPQLIAIAPVGEPPGAAEKAAVEGATPQPSEPEVARSAEPPAETASAETAPAETAPAEIAAAEPPTAEPPTAEPPAAEPPAAEKATAIVVKGLGSFGAITSFKQSLEGASGIGAVSLSLGPTGEFVYRATHQADLDLAAAITAIESGAEVEHQPDGSLRVMVRRGR